VFAYNTGDVQGAIDLFEEARKFDRWNFSYPMYLAQLYNNLAYQKGNATFNFTAVENAREAARLNDKSAQPMWVLAEASLAAGMPGEAVNTAEKAQQAAPWRQDGFENLTRIYLASANMFIQMDRKENARETLKKVIEMPQFIQARLDRLGANEREIWSHGPMPHVSDRIKQSIEQAEQMLGGL